MTSTSLNSLVRFLLFASVAFSKIPAAEPQSLNRTLEPYLKDFGLPALGVAVFREGVVISSGVVGTRRAGEDIPVRIDDCFHLGSDSKAFTSLLAAIFVEEGNLRWDSTLGEIFGELNDKMNPEFAQITVEELLSHSSGLSDGSEIVDLINRSYQQQGNMDEVRYWMVKETAPKPLDHPRGSKFDYSNLGYTIAGAILERIGGKSWEELVTERIIEPLELKSAGFGPQASLGKVDAPPGTPKTGGYALGWGQVTEDWAPDPVITHTGSNTLNLALAMFWPKTDFGFVIVTNIAGARADEAVRKLAVTLYQDFSGRP
jgi:CubicO group peptidase (beta-lactamase class C family)